MNKDDIRFMREALKLAKTAFDEDEVPIGAVIVYNSRIIAKGYNQVERLCDPTAHAEMIVITSAAEFLKSKWFNECTMYVTVEPCSMCAGALVLSRIGRVVFGTQDLKAGAFGSKLNINNFKLNHKIKIKKGVLEKECSQILSSFFKNKRRQKKLEITSVC